VWSQDGQVELAEVKWVGDHVDIGDLVVLDRELDSDDQPSAAGHDQSTAPLTSATRANRARRRLTRVSFATARAPRSSVAARAGSAARSARRTTPGSSSASSWLPTAYPSTLLVSQAVTESVLLRRLEQMGRPGVAPVQADRP
jgi:hypothetical protein